MKTRLPIGFKFSDKTSELLALFLGSHEWRKEIYNINQKLDKIMSAISDFTAAITPIIQKAGSDITQLVTDLTNQSTAITALNAQIAALQAQLTNSGTLSAADQQSLNDTLAAAQALQTAADTAAANAQSVTPPSVPVA